MDTDKVISGLEALYDSMHKNQCYACSYEFIEAAKTFGTEILADAMELLESNKTLIETQARIINDLGFRLKEQPQIVRCKDCKKRLKANCWVYFCGRRTEDNWFCADGDHKVSEVET